jgi:hypothetical protein
MTVILSVLGMGVLFAVFTLIGRSEKGCDGNCIGCTGDKTCESRETRS